MSGDLEDPVDFPDARAAEYVLGSLDAAERASVARDAATDPSLAADIVAWERRLHPMLRAVAPVEPPEFIWARIARDIGSSKTGSTMSDPNGQRNVTTRAQAGASRGGFWRIATFSALALAAGFAAFAFLRPPPAPVNPLAAAIVGTGGGGFLAQVLPNGAILLRPAGKVSIPEGKDLQLWALADGANAPTSLGVLPAGGIDLGKRTVSPDTKLLISLEPKGGSPTGGPTGPVEFAGTLLAPGASPPH